MSKKIAVSFLFAFVFFLGNLKQAEAYTYYDLGICGGYYFNAKFVDSSGNAITSSPVVYNYGDSIYMSVYFQSANDDDLSLKFNNTIYDRYYNTSKVLLNQKAGNTSSWWSGITTSVPFDIVYTSATNTVADSQYKLYNVNSAPLSLSLSASRSSISPGESVVLTYTVAGAKTCTSSSTPPNTRWWPGDAWPSADGTYSSYSLTLSTAGTYNFGLTCTSPTGAEITKEVNVVVSTTPTPTCSDGIKNGTETGIDCGGSCPACPTTPTCSDGIKNGTETGIDCGGSCPACATTYYCTGLTPSHSSLCSGDGDGLTADLSKLLVSSCSITRKCQYICNSGYSYSAGTGTCVADTVTYYCTGTTPSYSSLCSGDGDGLTADLSKLLVSSCNLTRKCQYICNSGYSYSAGTGTCVADDPPSTCGGGEISGYSTTVTGSTSGTVWGSGPYTIDSNLAAATVHKGLLRVGETSRINATSAGCLYSIIGSTQNGVTTSSWYEPYYGMNLAVTSPITNFYISKTKNPEGEESPINRTDIDLFIGSSAEFTYTVSGASSCEAASDSSEWEGPKNYIDGTYTTSDIEPLTLGMHNYTLTCYNLAGAHIHDYVSINVIPLPLPPHCEAIPCQTDDLAKCDIDTEGVCVSDSGDPLPEEECGSATACNTFNRICTCPVIPPTDTGGGWEEVTP